MSETNTIRLEKSQGIARITFDRPKHNVFDSRMIREFNAVLEALLQDDGLKCVVIFGEGRSWCAGVDVGDHRPEYADEMIAVFNRSFELIHAFEVPLIAAVHGACLGGGMEYAIAHWLVHHSAKWRHEQLKKELKEQWKEIEKHKWIESEKAGKDLGDTAAMDWIKKHAEEWRKWRRRRT